ncbi:glycosyltransferase family 2 protein [Actinocorallia lasiicapitis]
MITLSVVMPMRNVEHQVEALLWSLARNSRPDFEFLAVDDGSTDRTPALLARAAIPNLTVLTHTVPAGPSAARNTGLAAASGAYLTFLDGDDWIRPGYLADLVAKIEMLGCDFVISDHVQVRAHKRTRHRPPEGRRDRVLPARDAILPHHEASMVDYPYTWSGIYRRSLLDQGLLHFNPALHTAEDRPWFWRLYRRASTFAVTSLQGVHYRRDSPTSLTQIGDARQLHFFDAFDQVLSDLTEDPDPTRFHHKAIRNYCAIIAHHLTTADRLTPPVRASLHTRTRSTLATFPPPTLTEVLRGTTPDRRLLFTPYLP